MYHFCIKRAPQESPEELFSLRGTDGARTHDNQVVTLVLSQLSYRSKNCHLLPTHQHVSLRYRKNCCQHGSRA